MRNFTAAVLAALLAVNGAVLYATAGQLPARVASHFGGAGEANGFMLREDYMLLMTGLSIGIPLFLVLVLTVLPYRMPTRLRVPSRDYWIVPSRRDEALDVIATFGLIMSGICAAFVIATHLLVVEANHRIPPRLDSTLLYALVALLLVAILLHQFLFWRRFQVPQ